jgi:hypothetical protein
MTTQSNPPLSFLRQRLDAFHLWRDTRAPKWLGKLLRKKPQAEIEREFFSTITVTYDTTDYMLDIVFRALAFAFGAAITLYVGTHAALHPGGLGSLLAEWIGTLIGRVCLLSPTCTLADWPLLQVGFVIAVQFTVASYLLLHDAFSKPVTLKGLQIHLEALEEKVNALGLRQLDRVHQCKNCGKDITEHLLTVNPDADVPLYFHQSCYDELLLLTEVEADE